jgi:hypothetical protein
MMTRSTIFVSRVKAAKKSATAVPITKMTSRATGASGFWAIKVVTIAACAAATTFRTLGPCLNRHLTHVPTAMMEVVSAERIALLACALLTAGTTRQLGVLSSSKL